MADLEQHRARKEFPRNFLTDNVDLGNWDELSGYFQKLQERPLNTREEVEMWLSDLSELQAAVGEEYSFRYIRMTCHTDDPELEKAFLHFVENIMPKTEPEYFKLNQKYIASPARAGLPQDRFFVYDRARQNEIELFREENIALQTQDEILAQKYQKLCGEMSAEFDGKDQTLPQLAKCLEETDRERRQKAWLAMSQRQLADREQLESIFDEMVKLRTQMAQNAGFDNYIDYQFRRLGRFDYSPETCYAFHEAVEKFVMPIRREMRARRREELGLEQLAPWDLDVDSQGRPPLRPFENAEELIEGTDKIFAAVGPVFTKEFHILRDGGLLDLDSRKGKAPGGYQSTLDEARVPFIFMNAAGRNQDVFTLLHEGGHAFHALAARMEPLHAYRHAPIEFCEVASMGMEMMACEKLESFYDADSAARARRMHLEDVIVLLPWIARVDAFQHWIYTNPGHTRQERAAQWLELEKRFGDELDWSALPEWRECSWVSKLHFFCVPLYYIEYGIAQLGALQLWSRYLEDPEKAVTNYRAALRLGGSQPLPDLFTRAGLKFSFGEAIIRPLMEKVSTALKNS